MSNKDETQIVIRTLFSPDMHMISIVLTADKSMGEHEIKEALKFYTDDALKNALNEDIN